MQSVEAPSVKQGLKAVINNYPVLLITLSDFLGGFREAQKPNRVLNCSFRFANFSGDVFCAEIKLVL